MSNHQSHGTQFEAIIHPAFPGAADAVSHTAIFDIAADHDQVNHLPTSLKTTHNKTIGLADARRIMALDEPFRLVVGSYVQKSGHKEVQVIHEFEITPGEWNTLKGGLPDQVVSDFHEKLRSYPEGAHMEARAWARQEKEKLKQAYSNSQIQLNPKIDSQHQRRLQASIKLDQLVAAVASYTCHRESFREIALPIVLESGLRQRHWKVPSHPSEDEGSPEA